MSQYNIISLPQSKKSVCKSFITVVDSGFHKQECDKHYFCGFSWKGGGGYVTNEILHCTIVKSHTPAPLAKGWNMGLCTPQIMQLIMGDFPQILWCGVLHSWAPPRGAGLLRGRAQYTLILCLLRMRKHVTTPIFGISRRNHNGYHTKLNHTRAENVTTNWCEVAAIY